MQKTFKNIKFLTTMQKTLFILIHFLHLSYGIANDNTQNKRIIIMKMIFRKKVIDSMTV